MKYLFTVVALLGVCTYTVAQDLQDRKHNIQLSLPGLNFVNYGLSYEYAFHEKISAKTTLSTNVPIPISTLVSGTEQIIIERAPLKSFGVTPEIRFFPRSRDTAPDGLYIAIHGKYNRWTLDAQDVFYEENNGDRFEIDLDASLRRLGVGFTLGRQWIFAKGFSLDFWFLGLDLNSIQAKASGQSDQFETNDLETVEEILESLSIFNFEAEVDNSNKSIDAESNFLFPWFRFGLSLGYAF